MLRIVSLKASEGEDEGRKGGRNVCSVLRADHCVTNKYTRVSAKREKKNEDEGTLKVACRTDQDVKNKYVLRIVFLKLNRMR